MNETTMEKIKTLFDGEVTLKKRELWLIGACCLLAGIVYGLIKAPYTHGVKIGCDNGNHNGNGNSAAANEEDTIGEKVKKHGCCKKQYDIVLVKKD